MNTMRRLAQFILVCAFVIFGYSEAKAQTYTFGSTAVSSPSLSSSSPQPGNQPFITADFNGDGIPDMAIAGTIPSSTAPSGTQQVVSIYLGKSDGAFAAAVNYPLPSSTTQESGIVAGDFNGDAKLDIVVTGLAGINSSYILVGNGDGTFQAPVPVTNSTQYTAVAAADFNGDGKLDLVLATPNFGTGSTIAILLGNGDGTFQAPTTYSVSSGPFLAVGDFNGDGRPDIATAAGTTISVLINNGNGTFGTPINETITGNIQALAAADINRDGKLDLVVPFGGATAGVAILPGNGNGTFGTPIVYTNNLLNPYGSSVAIADFNGDGKLDLALTNPSSNANYGIAMLLGNGDGTFQSQPLLYDGGFSPSAIVAFDVNGDGKPDLVVAGGYGTDESLKVLLNHGDGTFPASVSYATALNPQAAVVGDFNGDGKPDIAVSSITYSSGTTGTPVSGAISVLLGNGDGTFKAHLDSLTGNFPGVIAEGDFNDDGIPDLVAIEGTPASGQILATWIGSGNGTFTEMPGPSLAGMDSIAVGDFNNDGKLDVAAVGTNNMNVYIFLGKGDGTFAAPTQYPVGSMSVSPPYHNVLTGDFRGDGKLDLTVATDNGVAILLGNGDGTFQPYTLLPPILTYDAGENLFALADFNGDGKLDILRCTGNDIIEVALGNGDGTFTAATGYQPPPILNPGAAVVGDFNGDGKPDVALAGQSNVMTILFGNGDGTFSAEADYGAQWNASQNFIASADFNGDGAPDVAMAYPSGGDVFVYLSSPVAAFSPRGLTFTAQGIGTTSLQQGVTLTNPSGVALAISKISASGDFAASNNCGSTLGPGKNCQADVTFSPTATGPRTGLLSFADSAESSAQTLALVGTGVQALAQLSPASLSFTSQVVGTTSAAQALTLTNSGDEALSISSIAISGDFAETNTCGATVPAGSSCTVSVTFTPNGSGTQSGTLTVTDNAPGSPQAAALSGTGTDFTIAPATGSAMSATVIAGQTATYSLVFTAESGFTGTASITCTGAPLEATCSVSPNSISLNGTASSTSTVTVTTTAASFLPPNGNLPQKLPWIILIALAAMSLVGLELRLRRNNGRRATPLPRYAPRVALAVVLLTAALAVGCGGGSTASNHVQNPGTPAGSYSLTVTGASGSLKHSVTLQLTVQ